MKKTLLLLAILVVGSIALAGCANQAKKEQTTEKEKMKIATTIFPLYDIIRQVGGDKIDPILILPPGSSPHTYEISPNKIKEAQGTKLFFVIGAGVDDWALNIANAINNVEIVDMDEYISLEPFEHQEHEDKEKGEYEEKEEHEDEHQQGDFDPHYWLSPDNAKIMAKEIASQLSNLDKEQTKYYENNAQAFVKKLSEKETEWKNKLTELNKKDLVVFHDAWGYFADYFGLSILTTFEPFPGKSPSPQYIIELQNKVKKHNISALFVEPQLSKAAITTLAQDLNVKIETLDPLGGVEDRDDYIKLIDYNISNIIKALK